MTELTQQTRTKGESSKAHAAYLDYRGMGVSRSLRKLHETYIADDSPTQHPTTRLRTLENWSAKYAWQKRIAEWEEHQQTQRDKQLERDRLAEREIRADILSKFREAIEDEMKHANLLSEVGIKAFAALTRAIKTYGDLSMKHYNDLPTERKDITSDDKPMAVYFVTEPIPQDLVNKRLEAMGLADMVEEQTE